MTSPAFDLAELIHPVEPIVFLRDYWQRRPLVLHRAAPRYYHRLLSMPDVDQLLQTARPRGEELLVLRDQDRLPSERFVTPAGTVGLGQLHDAYLDGFTIVVNGIERLWQPLTRCCLSLRHLLNHRVAANLYLAPRRSVSLKPHYDTHDVFVLQLDGAKRWSVHGRREPTPLVGSEQPLLVETELPALLHDVQLAAGDLIYLPRGFVHHARTADRASLHVTLGVYPAQWVDLLTEALRALSLEDERLREALPVGFMDQRDSLTALQERCRVLAAHFASSVSAKDGVERLTEQFIAETVPAPDAHLRELERQDRIGPGTRVVKRSSLKCMVRVQGSRATIRFPGRTVSGPTNISASLEFVARTEGPFCADDLPGDQGRDGKIALVRRLVRGGLLRTVLCDGGG